MKRVQRIRQRRRQHARDRGLTLAQWAQKNCLLLKALDKLDASMVHPIKKPKPLGKFPAFYYRMGDAERYAWRYKNEPEFALKERLRRQAKKHQIWGCIQTRIRASVKNNKPRGGALFEYLGYTPTDLRRHLERQFRPGMNWKAFEEGRIHIDHVVPVSSFDLTRDEEVRRCWAMTNLQPLWSEDNLAKSARRTRLL